jgi:uncharacterized protein YbjT (DUF2867 family)
VRVLTRDPARARHLAERGVEVVRGDVRDPAHLAQAVRGAGTVISAVHGFAGPGGVSPATVDGAGNANLIRAAARAGAWRAGWTPPKHRRCPRGWPSAANKTIIRSCRGLRSYF